MKIKTLLFVEPSDSSDPVVRVIDLDFMTPPGMQFVIDGLGGPHEASDVYYVHDDAPHVEVWLEPSSHKSTKELCDLGWQLLVDGQVEG